LTSSAPQEIMRIALVHTLFEEAGGGERLALEMYRALKDLEAGPGDVQGP